MSPRVDIRILFTCIGRRVELVRAFRGAAKKLKLRLEIHGADASRLAPALQFVDRKHIVPPVTSPEYGETLCKLVRREKIRLLIPLIDHELEILADARETLAEAGCTALISSPDAVRTCRDKLATYEAFKTAGIDAPFTLPWAAMVEQKRHRFPYFMKPRRGSAAMGNFVIRNAEELRALGPGVPEPIVQEFIEGVEYTLDVYTGLDGKPRCVVPRRRLEVRVGEVSKSLVVKDKALFALGRRAVGVLPGCRGLITVQCIKTPAGRICVIEINPRFGGGAPLSIHAGADFPKWILMETLGKKPKIAANAFRDDVAMLRYDDSVFIPRASAILASLKS